MLVTYMGRMRNNNLEIKIAGSSCRPQLTPRPWRLRHTRRQVAPIRLCNKPLGVHTSDGNSRWNDAEQVAVTFNFVWQGEFLCLNLCSAAEFGRLVERKKFCLITGKETQISTRISTKSSSRIHSKIRVRPEFVCWLGANYFHYDRSRITDEW